VFVPKFYAVDDPDLLERFILENSFGLLICCDGGQPFATHIPLLYDRSRSLIEGHVAKANSQWKLFDGRSALCVFSGPHAYVSSMWYESTPNVPTWNYVAVHVHGRVTAIEDRDRTVAILHKTVATYDPALHERGLSEPEQGYFDKLVPGIVAFEMPIDRIQGKLKMNQNKTEQDRRNVVSKLEESGAPDALAVAELMQEFTL
jgi:transcriptional regulator